MNRRGGLNLKDTRLLPQPRHQGQQARVSQALVVKARVLARYRKEGALHNCDITWKRVTKSHPDTDQAGGESPGLHWEEGSTEGRAWTFPLKLPLLL